MGWPLPHLGGGAPGRRCKDPEVEVWSLAWGEVRGCLWPDQCSFRKCFSCPSRCGGVGVWDQAHLCFPRSFWLPLETRSRGAGWHEWRSQGQLGSLWRGEWGWEQPQRSQGSEEDPGRGWTWDAPRRRCQDPLQGWLWALRVTLGFLAGETGWVKPVSWDGGAVVDRVGRKGGCLRGMGSRVAWDPSRHWNSVVRLECGQRSGVQTQVCWGLI